MTLWFFVLVVVFSLNVFLSYFAVFFFFFQAEDGIRDAQESRGLGDVYKRQCQGSIVYLRKKF